MKCARKPGEANNPKKTVSTVKHGGTSNKNMLILVKNYVQMKVKVIEALTWLTQKSVE